MKALDEVECKWIRRSIVIILTPLLIIVVSICIVIGSIADCILDIYNLDIYNIVRNFYRDCW